MNIRAGCAADLAAVRRLLDRSPEAAQWIPNESELFVAEYGGEIAGMLAWRVTAPDEKEILNLAVDPAFRRRGVAMALLAELVAPTIFLEVRESNRIAMALYRKAGFEEAGLRRAYYLNPAEAAIVMRLQS